MTFGNVTWKQRKQNCVISVGVSFKERVRALYHRCNEKTTRYEHDNYELTENLQRSRYLYPCLLVLAAASALPKKKKKEKEIRL